MIMYGLDKRQARRMRRRLARLSLPNLCRTCGTEHDGEHATDCERCARINAEWAEALTPRRG